MSLLKTNPLVNYLEINNIYGLFTYVQSGSDVRATININLLFFNECIQSNASNYGFQSLFQKKKKKLLFLWW